MCKYTKSIIEEYILCIESEILSASMMIEDDVEVTTQGQEVYNITDFEHE